MRIVVFTILLFSSLCVFSQANFTKFYVNPNISLKQGLSSGTHFFAADISGGFNFKSVSIGAGIETMRIIADVTSALPVFIDVAYYFKNSNGNRLNKLRPFTKVKLGKLFWNAEQKFGSVNDNNTVYHTGKQFLTAEFGSILLRKGNSGFAFGVAFRIFGAHRYSIHRTTLLPNGTIGPLVETKSPNRTEGFSEIALKLGYQF